MRRRTDNPRSIHCPTSLKYLKNCNLKVLHKRDRRTGSFISIRWCTKHHQNVRRIVACRLNNRKKMDRRTDSFRSIRWYTKLHQNMKRILTCRLNTRKRTTRQTDRQAEIDAKNVSELIGLVKPMFISKPFGCCIHPHLLNIVFQHTWCRVKRDNQK